MKKLNNLLRQLAGVNGIRAAMLVGREGFVIDGVSNSGEIDNEAIAATISAEISSAETMGGELEAGRLRQMMIEFEAGTIFIVSLGKDAILAAVTASDAIIGYVRYQLEKFALKIEELL